MKNIIKYLNLFENATIFFIMIEGKVFFKWIFHLFTNLFSQCGCVCSRLTLTSSSVRRN